MSLDLRLFAFVVGLIALGLLTGLVSLHEKHYSRREMILLRNRVEGIERLLIEDRTV